MKATPVLSILIALSPLVLAENNADYVPLQALPGEVPVTENNPQNPAKIALGKQLYFDVRLSASDTLSCNSCHDLAQGGVDHLPLSTGASGLKLRRSTPTVFNAAFNSVQFWDGRAANLESAITDHLLDPSVMAMANQQAVLAKLTAIPAYRTEFAQVFGGADSLGEENISQAIASYLRTLITPDSAFDRYIKGDAAALSVQAQRGMEEFQSVGCVSCHFGSNFAGPPVPIGEGFYELFPNYLGSQYDEQYHLVTDDQGQYEATGDPIHKRLFRMPTLRNIALTAPYFHTGSVATLDEAVRVMGKTQLEVDLSEQQTADIVAFLESLTGKLPVQNGASLNEE